MNDKYASITEGLEENLRGNKEAGTFSITTDLRNVYYNFTAEERIKLGTGKNLPNGAEIFNDYVNCQATGRYAHAENSSRAFGNFSHSEGLNCESQGTFSHAEGGATIAVNQAAHSEGFRTLSQGEASHSEGYYAQSIGDSSHSEGYDTQALGDHSHSEGHCSIASGESSHAEGDHTVASGDTSHAQGRYNIPNDNYADVIGNGSSGTDRSNAYTMDWKGNAWYAGDVYVGSTSGKNKDDGSKKLATEEYVDTQIISNIDQTYSPTSENAQSGIAVAEALSGYVMAEVGKGLSSNDFTNEDKEKLGSALQADDISNKMDKFGTVELDGTRLGDVTASVKNFQLLNLTGESGLGLGNYEASLYSKGRTVISRLNAETGDSTEVAVSDGVVTLSKAGKIDVILNGVATPTDDNHGANKQYVDEAVAEALSGYVMAEVGKGLSTNDFTDDDKKQVDNSIKIAGISNGELSFEMNAGVYNIKAFTKITFRTYASSSDGMTTMGSTKLGSTSTDTFLFVSSISTIPSYRTKEFRLLGGNRETVYRITRATNAATGEYTDTLTDETPKVDQTYTPTSPNAQSGIATAEAVGVANDYTDKAIKSLKTYANNTFAPAIKNTVSGSVLAVHDVSPVEHDLGVSVRSKNLIDYSACIFGYELTSTGNDRVSELWYTTDFIKVEPNRTYILSGTSSNFYNVYDSNKKFIGYATASPVITNSNTAYIRLNSLIDGYDKPQLELGSTATPYTPYVSDFSEVSVSRCGKNLIPSLRTVSPDVNYYGITFTNNEDGSITANGTAVHGCYYWLTGQNSILLPAGTYIFSSGLEDGSTSTQYASFTYGTGKEVYSYAGKNGKFILTEPTLCGCCFSIHEGTVLDNVTLYPQLELGSTATDYEPYNGQTVNANTEGTVEGIKSVSPNMTIMSDTEGVVIDMTYNADTKMYIDNKIAELSAAIVNNT